MTGSWCHPPRPSPWPNPRVARRQRCRARVGPSPVAPPCAAPASSRRSVCCVASRSCVTLARGLACAPPRGFAWRLPCCWHFPSCGAPHLLLGASPLAGHLSSCLAPPAQRASRTLRPLDPWLPSRATGLHAASARVAVLFRRQRAEPSTDATWRSDSPVEREPVRAAHVDPIRGLHGWAGPTRRLAALPASNGVGLVALRAPPAQRAGRTLRPLDQVAAVPRHGTPRQLVPRHGTPRQLVPCHGTRWHLCPFRGPHSHAAGTSRQPTRPEDRTCPSSGSPPVLPAWIRSVALAGGLVACGAAPRTTHRPRS